MRHGSARKPFSRNRIGTRQIGKIHRGQRAQRLQKSETGGQIRRKGMIFMYKQYIGGKTVEGHGKPLAVLNPATGETIAEFKTAVADQAEAALEAARGAFKMWSDAPVGERIGWMLKLREACLAEKEKIIA